MEEIWIILACVPLYIVNSFCDKFISTVDNNKHNFLYNCVKFLAGMLFLLPFYLTDGADKFGFGVLICGLLCGVSFAVNKTVILQGYERTSVAFMTFCHASGMLLPCILGQFFWGEKLSLLASIGVVLTVSSIVLLKGEKTQRKGFDGLGILFGVLVFLGSGGVMIAQKLMGRYFATQSVSAFNIYSFATAFAILCFFAKPKGVQKRSWITLLLCALGSTLALTIVSMVMTNLSGSVPSIILFPLFNGLGIISVCVGSTFVFKEKWSIKKVVGLIVGMIGLCLVNL